MGPLAAAHDTRCSRYCRRRRRRSGAAISKRIESARDGNLV
jgi:hypothetical protein